MKQDVMDQITIRQYLLGEVTQEEKRALIEERLLVDDDFFEEFQLVNEDLIDQYVGRELTEEERERFEQNFLTTPERWERLRQAQALARYADKSLGSAPASAEKKVAKDIKRQRTHFAWAWLRPMTGWRLAASVLLLVGLALGLWRLFLYRSDVERGLLALQSAHRLQRPVEARLSGFDYAPLAQTRGDGKTNADPISRQRAERILLDAVNDDPGPASYHALGLFYLTELGGVVGEGEG
jgi:hypothetical protein